LSSSFNIILKCVGQIIGQWPNSSI